MRHERITHRVAWCESAMARLLLRSIFTDLLAKFSHLSSNFHPKSRDILLIIGKGRFLSHTKLHRHDNMVGRGDFSPKMFMQFTRNIGERKRRHTACILRCC